MQTVVELPLVPWIGRLSPPMRSDAQCASLARVLAAANAPTIQAPKSARRASAVLAVLAISLMFLHNPAPSGSLRALVGFEGVFRSVPSGDLEMAGRANSTSLAATIALGLTATPPAWAGLELHCVGACVGTPSNIDLSNLRSLTLGSAVYQDGSFLVWNFGGEQWGQFDVPSSIQQVSQLEISRHALALLTDGTVAAWGANNFGQSTPPVGLQQVRLIRVGEFHSVAVRQDDSVVCWGNNGVGQCDPPTDLGAITDVRAGSHNVALRPNATIKCWGWNGWGQCEVPAGLEPIKAISVAYAHTVVLTADSRVRCWGRNAEGQCNAPQNLEPVRAVAAGGLHTAALLESGQVVCWGSNTYGQCNTGGFPNAALVVGGGSQTLVLQQVCSEDVDHNNLVNGVDLAIVLSKWGTSGGKDYPGADVDHSGLVDGSDLAQVLNSWGACP